MGEEEESGLPRLSKRFSDKVGEGEVDYKTKSGSAWSHSYLNQKPWHPLSYPNQRRKWIAEQTDAQKQRRAEEVAREFAQEQEFFKQMASFSKKEKEKVELMKAVSFMYVRPPGYNAESAKAAEIADEQKNLEEENPQQDTAGSSHETIEAIDSKTQLRHDKKKPRPKDVFGRALPTAEEFEVLKDAPRLETGMAARVKPFAVEVRNVKCVRCGKFGHQSGDRECPLKDIIMPNDESRKDRDDPLKLIISQTEGSEPLKWELKQRPGGMSPPRGGFMPDDPNQQIVPEYIFDEYGGYLDGDIVPAVLANISTITHKHSKKRSKHKKSLGEDSKSHPSSRARRMEKNCESKSSKGKHHSRPHLDSSASVSDKHGHRRKEEKQHPSYNSGLDSDERRRSKKKGQYYDSSSSDSDGHRRKKKKHHRRDASSDSDSHKRKRPR